MLTWIKGGFTATDGTMDDARVNAALTFAAYIAMGLYGIHRVESHDIAAFVQAWAIGAAALAGGVGALFGLRKDN